MTSAWTDPEGGSGPVPPGKLQLTIGFLRNSGPDPNDPLGSNCFSRPSVKYVDGFGCSGLYDQIYLVLDLDCLLAYHLRDGALLCVMFYCVFVTSSCGVLG